MNVCIARDGEEIGEFPREKLEDLAREGRLQPTDYYWREGLVDWARLESLLGVDAWEPAPEPRRAVVPPDKVSEAVAASPARSHTEPVVASITFERRRFSSLAALGAIVVAVGLTIYFVRSGHDKNGGGGFFPPSPDATPSAPIDRDLLNKAIVDLQQRMQRLPRDPVEPLYTSFYDVTARVNRTTSKQTPWAAVIHGGENQIDPVSGATAIHTDFVIAADFTDGVWTFRNYHASRSDMVTEVTTEIQEDETTVMPPSIIGILGLKMGR